jgi:hypothetical protein
MNDDASHPWAPGSSGVTPVDELQPAPGDLLDSPLRELRRLRHLQPPAPPPELNQLLLTGLPSLRSGRTRRRTILVSGALAVAVATGVSGMAAAHDSPRTGVPVQTSTTSQFDPGDHHQQASLAPRPSPVVPPGAPSTPTERESDPTPSERADDRAASSSSVTQASAPSRSATPRRESEAPDDRARFISPGPRPSTSFTHRDE